MNQPGFNQHIGQTIRPPSTALLTVDSEDRFPDYPTKRQTLGQYAAGDLVYNASPYYFTISKNESLMNGFFTRLAVTEVVFPWSIPNINNTCSSIYFNYNIAGGVSGETLIRVPTNFYNPSALAAFLQAEINTQVGALAGDFKMVYSPDPAIADAPLSFYYYSNGGANQYSFSPLPYNSLIYPYPATTKQLFDVLGFVNIRNTIFRTNTYGESSFAQSTRYVDICCSQLIINLLKIHHLKLLFVMLLFVCILVMVVHLVQVLHRQMLLLLMLLRHQVQPLLLFIETLQVLNRFNGHPTSPYLVI